MRRIRLGTGAGYSGDRIEPAIELARHGRLDYLVFECLAERTIALAQGEARRDPLRGYDPLLEARMRAVLPDCRAQGVRIVTNMGAANPRAAARRVLQIAGELGLDGLRVAAVTGDDVLSLIERAPVALDIGGTSADLGARIISANAYLGAEPVAAALAAGAEVVVTGRVADPALFLGPLMHEFGWSPDDPARMGQGVLAGHLLECAGQLTGGYFAEPGLKEVPDMHRLGFPIGEVGEDGGVTLSKVAGSGGRISLRTVKEQLLYEVHDPAAYIQPNVVADFSGVRLEELGPDSIRASGAGGRARTGKLKVSVGYLDGWIGEGQIAYAGPGAPARARLAREIVRERLRLIGLAADELSFDLIGVDALHGPDLSRGAEPWEVRLRVAGRCAAEAEAARIGNEVESLYTNGPAGGGGAWKSVRRIVAIASGFIDAAQVHAGFEMVTEAQA
ncbi:acyclic terpene utilization AtuA family protein [Pararhodobacter sp.]|uniref:acyclic terpene utilization AtuA family protein n=1 Tax=Pararhodobacter sp. TaxID=2127056 RepID=UPI002FDEA17C